jgi:DNA-binding transcriptional regulator YhcF (GntR family)
MQYNSEDLPRFVIDPEGADVHRQLIEQILDRIALGVIGVLRPGDKLPTNATLCEELGVSHGTIVRVNKYLENIGVITANSKGGTRVAEASAEVAEAVIDAYAARRIGMVLLELKRTGVGLDNIERAIVAKLESVYGKKKRTRAAAKRSKKKK